MAGCDDTTGVYLSVHAGLELDRLRVTALTASGPVVHEAGGPGAIHFPATLLATFPPAIGEVGFTVDGLLQGAVIASGSLPSARVPPHEVVDRALTLAPGGVQPGDGPLVDGALPDGALPDGPTADGPVTLPTYSRQLTVPRGQARSMNGDKTLPDFPVLLVLADPTLRSASNGGHVALDDGSDLFFTAGGATCGVPASLCVLDRELERYDPVGGTLVAWVRVPSLNLSPSSDDTVFTLRYGNPQAAPVPAPARTWEASFRGVWHLAGGAAADSSSGAHAGVATGTSSVEAKIGGGLAFDGAQSYVDVADADALDARGAVDFTLSLWVKTAQSSGTARLISKRDPASGSGYEIALHASAGDLWAGGVSVDGALTQALGRTNLNDGNWHFVTFVRQGLSLTSYDDGLPPAPKTTAAEDDLSNALPLRFGASSGAGLVDLFAGQLDEVRFSTTARSFNWIAVDYANQSAPSSFVQVGPEVAP